MLGRIVEGTLDVFISMGIVWSLAWAYNPHINSNTVWFVAMLFGFLVANIMAIRRELDDGKTR